MHPGQRFAKIQKLAETINKSSLEGIQIQIRTDTNRVEGYQLDYPILEGQEEFKGGDIINIKGLYKEKDLKYWMFFYDYRHSDSKKSIFEDIRKSGKRYGI